MPRRLGCSHVGKSESTHALAMFQPSIAASSLLKTIFLWKHLARWCGALAWCLV